VMRVSTIQLRRLVREVLVLEYVSSHENDPETMAAKDTQRKDLLDMLTPMEDIPEVAEFLDVVSGADRNASTDPRHDRFFTQDDVDHVVTVLQAEEEDETARALEDIDFTEYFI
jgi:hypothetical protein